MPIGFNQQRGKRLFPGQAERNLLFICYVGTMMVPSMVTLIPRYVIMSKLGWVNTHISVIAPVLLGTPFAVFLMRQFFMTLPQQLMDAAVIDGASYPRVFFRFTCL